MVLTIKFVDQEPFEVRDVTHFDDTAGVLTVITESGSTEYKDPIDTLRGDA